jgi:hypothetical protein
MSMINRISATEQSLTYVKEIPEFEALRTFGELSSSDLRETICRVYDRIIADPN